MVGLVAAAVHCASRTATRGGSQSRHYGLWARQASRSSASTGCDCVHAAQTRHAVAQFSELRVNCEARRRFLSLSAKGGRRAAHTTAEPGWRFHSLRHFSTDEFGTSAGGSAGAASDASKPNSEARAYNTLLMTQEQNVAVVRLNRPKVLNAFDDESTSELLAALRACDQDRTVRCIVITGTGRAFAAGADISEMATRSMQDQSAQDAGAWIDSVARVRTPLVAAVNGFALGGGCELALACDVVLAATSAQFGQPEVQIGTIPGWGGTQRLIRAIGKAKAMEMILTGRRMQADEAERAGLVARVLPDEQLMAEALAVATVIASYSAPVVRTAKQCVNLAHEVPLSAGLKAERAAFHSTFALEDQKEGMLAFLDKRSPHWRHK
ncbi:putative enoyl-CoA hydratase echA8 [Porphyridium purpureum]|uniref:Putative enoyl-CoA hydratase echA8 n=1 Tax=Porphyridium purpureum TaxID=35688 RepID=A0A5J4Z4L8_PORPP|nr:putative enoyl-CoA hydratase echA8 [Porphyridium purpureum]|eukprot:POR5990..scf295_1